jgi:hypothetical protein
MNSNIPETDRLFLWEFVLKNSKKLFSIHIDCSKESMEGIVEQE